MTVKIEQLAFYNAFTYRQCVVPLADQGLVLLQGKNGHGKSTIWEVLEHTFYGYTSRGLRKGAIVCTIPRGDAKEEAGYLSEVILSRDSGKHVGRWLIRQAREHGKYGTAVQIRKEIDGKWKKEWEGGGCPKGLEDAQALANELLGLKQNEFEGCLYLSQSGTHTLIEGKPAEKQLYIAYLFGADCYDEIQSALSKKASSTDKQLLSTVSLEAKLELLNGHLTECQDAKTLEHEIADLTEAIRFADGSLKKWRTKRDEARDSIKTWEQRQSLQADLTKIGNVDEEDYPDIDQQIEKKSQRKDTLTSELRDAERRDRLTKQLTDLGDVDEAKVKDIKSKIEATRVELSDFENAVRGISQRKAIEAQMARIPAQQSVEELTEQVSFVEKSLEVKRAKYKERMAEHKEMDAQAKEFKEGVCPTCKRPMDLAAMKARLDDLAAELQTLYDDIQKPKQKLETLKAALENAQKHDELAKKVRDLPAGDLEPAEAKVAAARQSLDNLTDLNELWQKVKAIREQLEAIKSKAKVDDLQDELRELADSLRDLTEISKQLAQRKSILRQLAKLPEVDVEQQRTDLDLADKAYGETQTEVLAAQAKLSTAQSSLSSRQAIESDIAKVSKELEGLEGLRRQQKILKYAMAVVPRLKRRKIHKIVCAIRDVLPRYAGTMFSHEPNTTFILKEDEKEESIDLLARRLVEVNGKLEPILVPVKGFSGGEKQRLSVALLFTLHCLLDPSKRPDLLILDEADKNLDDLGVASLMALVSEVKDQYGTVVMTSHRSQISGAHFERTWRVEKQNEESRFYSE